MIVLPTDTVYGIAADAFDPVAVRRLLAAKGRGRDMPPPVLVSSATTLDALAVRVPGYARALVEEFWPGPLTLVCHQQASLQWDLGDTRGTVAVRMPDHAIALADPRAHRPARGQLGQPDRHAARPPTPTRPRRCSATSVDGDRRRGGRHPVARRRRSSTSPGARGRVLRRGALSLERPQRGPRAARARRSRTRARPLREYLLVFLVAAATTYLLTVIAREIALRTGAVAAGPRPRRARRTRSRTSAGSRCSAAWSRRTSSPAQLPFLSTSGPFVFRDAGIVLIAGALICAVGVLDDLLRARRAHQAGRAGARGRLPDRVRHPVRLLPGPDGSQFSLDPAQGALLTGVHRGRHRQRGELRRRPRRPGRRGGRASARSRSSSSATSSPTSTTCRSRRPGALLSAALGRVPVPASCPHNFHPARLFMGDSGSMLIGLVLSASAVTLTGQFSRGRDHRGRAPARRPACCRRCCRCCCRCRS